MDAINFSSATTSHQSYEQAFDMFRYRMKQLDDLTETKYIIEKIKEISTSNYIDPNQGPFHKDDLSILYPNTSKWLNEINEEAKKYLGVESIEEGVKRANNIRSDFTHLFNEFSHVLDKSEKSSLQEIPQLPLKKRNSAVNPIIPPEKACPLIREKLANPTKELTIEDSINLLTTCIKYGEARAEKVKNKQVVVVIGNTGAGKSTFVNYLYGCEFKIKEPKDVGLRPEQCLNMILGVKEGSEKSEIMKIGHTNKSETFMPEIATDDQGFTYCDCPGFLDNRGAEINIANAVNIKNALRQAQGVKVIILINRNSLFAERGRGFREMIQIASHLFGSRENLLKYKDSILLGVTQLEEAGRKRQQPLELLKKQIVETDMNAFDKAALTELSECLFIYDPLNATNLEYEGALKRGEIIGKIACLKPIKNSEGIFQTVLGDTDEKKLISIVEKMEEQIKESLEKRNFNKAASLARNLKPLEIIGHSFINTLLAKNTQKISRYFINIASEFKLQCAQKEFEKAKALLEDLENAAQEFGPTLEMEDLNNLRELYNALVNKKKVREEKKRVEEKIVEFKDHCDFSRLDQAEKVLKELENTIALLTNPDLKQFEEQLISRINLKSLQSHYQRYVSKKAVETVKKDIDTKKVEFNLLCTNEKFAEAEKLFMEIENIPTQFRQSFPSINEQEISSHLQLDLLQSNYKIYKDRHDQRITKEKVDEFNQLCMSNDLLQKESASRGLKILKELIDLKYKDIDGLRQSYQESVEKSVLMQLRVNIDIEKRKFNNCCKAGEFNLVDQMLNRFESIFFLQKILREFESFPREFIQCLYSDEIIRGINSSIQLEVLREEYYQEMINSIAFGAEKWNKYFGDIGIEPPLPQNIRSILNSPCPFWPDKKVRETHLLVLVPATVDGKQLTLNSLQKLIKKPKNGHKTQYRHYEIEIKNELGNQSTSSHWVLMTKDVIPDSRDKSYKQQKKLLSTYTKKSDHSYELPTALEAVTCILMEYVQTGTKLYNDSPYTLTYCQEIIQDLEVQVGIGGFGTGGLCISADIDGGPGDDYAHFGVGGVWKFI